MRSISKLKGLSAVLVTGASLMMVAPALVLNVSCSVSKDKTGNLQPSISSFSASQTSTTPFVANTKPFYMTVGTPAYLVGNFAATGGSALLTPGNISVTSGVPVAVNPATSTTYTLTVTDAAGHVATLAMAVNPVEVPSAAIAADTAVITGTAGLQASVANAPLATYSWTAVNATITSATTLNAIAYTAGSANADGSTKPMTLTCEVTNAAGLKDKKTATLNVTPVPPVGLSYAFPASLYYLGLPIQMNAPTFTGGGIIQGYTVTPALPAGLALDPLLGTITGTPSALTAAGNYTVTAFNMGGISSFPVNIQVQAAPALTFNTPSPGKIGLGGGSILSWSTGAGVLSVNITASPADASLVGPFGIGSSPSTNVHPLVTTTYTLTGNLIGNETTPALTSVLTVDATPLAFSNFTTDNALLAFGGNTTLRWTLTGTPVSLLLDGATSMLGATTYSINPTRRHTYSLTGTNNVNTVSATVAVAAKGLDVLAGNANMGAGMGDGTGTNAQFNGPQNIAIDPAGNIYVPDAGNHSIRVITPAGVVSTIAGKPGFPGTADGVTGLSAQFNAPRGVAFWHDSVGNVDYLFVADNNNHAVRKVTLGKDGSGHIIATMVAVFGGKVGTAAANIGDFASMKSPESIVIDASNNLYVVEYGYDDVLKCSNLTAATGTFTLFAGTRNGYGFADGAVGTAKLNYPNSITADAAGNLYVSENVHRIRKISPTGNTSIFVGAGASGAANGTSGFQDGTGSAALLNAPGAVCVFGNFLYIADTKNQAIRKVDLTSQVVTTVLGAYPTATTGTANGNGNSALFNGPQGLAFDASGNLFVAELNNQDVRKVSTALAVSNFAGASPVVGSADSSVGNPAGAMAISPGLSANITYPGLALDANRNLYVADVYNHTIRKITNNGVMTTVAGLAGTAGSTDGAAASATFNQPQGIAMDANNNLYVTDTNNSVVRKLTWDAVNNVYSVARIAGQVGVTGAADGNGLTTASFKYPRGIVVSPDGQTIYVVDTSNSKIRKMVWDSVNSVYTVSSLVITGAALNTPVALAADAAFTKLYVTERYSYYVAQVVMASGVATVIGGKSGTKGYADGVAVTSSLFLTPQGISLDLAGNVYVADFGNGCIRKITVDTSVTPNVGTTAPVLVGAPAPGGPTGTVLGPLPSTLMQPTSVLVTPDGHDLYITTNGGVAQATSIDGQ